MPPVTPLMFFTLTKPGSAPGLFTIERVANAPEGGIDIHGYFTDRVALDGNVIYRPDVDGLEFTLQIENATEDMDLRLGAFLELTGEADPRWLIPGLFYRENKPAGCQLAFPAYHEFTREPRQLVSSHWSFRSDRAATPAVFSWTYGCFAFFSTAESFGVTPDHPEGAGMTSLYMALEDGNPRLGGEYPYREAPAKFSFCHDDGIDPEETFLHLPMRTPLLINFVVGFAPPDLHAYDRVLRGIAKRNTRFHTIRGKGTPVDAERCAHIGLFKWHYNPPTQAIYESAVFDRHFGQNGSHFERTHMHTGGKSGAFPAYVLLWGGREAQHQPSIEAGIRVLDKISSELSPAGTVFPMWTEEFGWSCSFGPEEGTAHSRTVAEAVFFLTRAARLELKADLTREQWLGAIASSVNYAMSAQRQDGAFPSYFDLTTGRPTSYEGFAGAAWIPAIAAASAILYRPHFREVLVAAATYYMDLMQQEFLCGSVEDQPLVPTCDDAHWAVIAFLTMYEFDRDPRWLALAIKAADYALTWRFTYNVSFPKGTFLGKMDFKTRGGDIFSVASPYLCCNGLVSYPEFLKLSALTGDKYYKDRAEDARTFASQLVATEEADLNARIGMTMSQVYHTDWIQPKGRVLATSSAYTCALIRYAELVKRNLEIPAAVFEGQDQSELAVEFGATPVLYSEVTLTPDAAKKKAADEEAIKPSFSSFSKFLSEDKPAPRRPTSRGGDSASDATPLGVPGMGNTPLPLQTPVGFGRAASSDAVPKPFGGPPRENASQGEDSEGEIKYKIF
ncbi:MAG: hypothetical protein SF028_10335 [Candidatus Sumerlaeia bacterium]|nr:hypothetical protein [Candidatus Sumerlaeia bacterium]